MQPSRRGDIYNRLLFGMLDSAGMQVESAGGSLVFAEGLVRRMQPIVSIAYRRYKLPVLFKRRGSV